MENKKLSLEHKIQVLEELAASMQQDAEDLRETLKRLDGFAYGHKELVGKYKGHVEKQQEELAGLVKSSNLAPAVANFVLTYTAKSQKFLENAQLDARKLLHTRQGELVSLVSQLEKLKVSIESVKSEIEALKEEEKKEAPLAVSLVEEPVETPSEKSEKKEEMSGKKGKKKTSRGRPDQAGPLAATVKRLKEARKKLV
jgi:chromosome segregation ATPase